MSEYLIQGETLTELGDKIRVLSGIEGTMLPSEMTANVQSANDEVDAQAALIEQLSAALDGKVASGNIERFVEFSQVNPVVAEYLMNVSYDSNNYTTTGVVPYKNQTTEYRKDQPNGYSVTLADAGVFGVCDGNKSNHMISIEGENKIYNVTPNMVGEWWNMVDGNIKQCGTIKPTGTIRMIALGDVSNVRDLGGWDCDGGKVKYGKLFRGGALYGNTSDLVVSITDTEKDMCRNLLGIRHELDFRVSSETTGQSGSALGKEVEYTNIPIGAITSNYALMVDLNGSYTTQIRNILLTVFEAVKDNHPLYMHCTFGADRTAVVAFILNGLLGVSQSDLDKDYELTSFYTYRPRVGEMYKGLIEYFNSFNGNSMRDNIIAWCVQLGISIDTINEYRQNMVDGNPENIIVQVNELPSEYEAVAYIDHPDTANNIANAAYCDLGITGRTGLVIKGKTMAYAIGDTYLVGSTDGTDRLLAGSQGSYIKSATGPTMGGSVTYQVTNAECEFEFSTIVNNSYMKTNIPSASTAVHTETIANTAAFDNGYTMSLFCRNNKGTYQRIFSGRLYWLTIEENGAEIMKLLPCRRKSDSVVGLYDTVGKRFITSANSVAFTASN